MYSPKIKEDLIPKLYLLAKAKGIKMTTLVNQILRDAIHSKEVKTCKIRDKTNTLNHYKYK